MSSEFDQFISEGITEFFQAAGEKFTWNGREYDCAVDHLRHTLTTAKSLFIGGKYPQRGQTIVVAGKSRQVTKLANSQLKAAAGGMIEDQPFIDDPADPTLDIEFDKFIKR